MEKQRVLKRVSIRNKHSISTLGEYSFQKTYLGLKASIAKEVSG